MMTVKDEICIFVEEEVGFWIPFAVRNANANVAGVSVDVSQKTNS